MIRTVGLESEFEKCEIRDVYDYFKDHEIIQFDTETTALNSRKGRILCAQVGDATNQFVIEGSLVPELKQLLESKTLLGHNLKFDLGFLYAIDIWPNKVWDTFLAEAVLYCGLKLHKKGLKDVAFNRLGVNLDKSVRDEIWKEGLTKRVIEYSAEDVVHLEAIKVSQEAELTQKGLTKTLELENEFVLVLAYIESSGFKFDAIKWKAKADRDKIAFEASKEALDQWILDNKVTQFIDTQGDLFSTRPRILINWSSSRQVVELFKKLGIPVEVDDHGETKESVEAKQIEKYRKTVPIVDLYLTYKEKEKLVTTYGYNVLEYPHTDGRIYTNFRQIMDTGRISSGSRRPYPALNFQNIPSDPETRSCFISEEGNTLIIEDYHAEEPVVLANSCLDPNLLSFYDSGTSDMHSYIASKVFKELGNVPLEDIKEYHKDKRQIAKIVGLSVNYGASGSTIAANANISLEEGDRVYNDYFKLFPGLKLHFEKVSKQVLRDGYVLISELTGRKSYCYEWAEYNRLKKLIDSDFWEKYREEKNKSTLEPTELFLKMKETVSKFFQIKGGMERKAYNWPIQGKSGSISKLSAIYMFNWVKEQKLLNVVKFVNQIHDENVLECPVGVAPKVAEVLQDCMNRAGDLYCKRVPLRASIDINKFWRK